MSASDNLFTLWGRLASTVRLVEGSWTFSLAVATADGRVNYPLITLPEEPPRELVYHDAAPLKQQMWVGVVGQVKTHNVEHSVLSYVRYILSQVGAGSYGDLFNVLLPAEIAQRLVKEVKYEFRVQPGKVFVAISEQDRPSLTNFFMLRGRLASPVRRRGDLWVCTLAVTEQTRVVDYPTLTLGLAEPPEGLVYRKGKARRHQPLLRVVGELGTRRTRRTALNYIRYILRRVRASDSADLFEMFLPVDVGRRIIRETEYNLLADAEKIVIEKPASRPEPVPAEVSEVIEAAEAVAVAGEDSEVVEAVAVAGEDSEVIEAAEVAAEDSEVVEAVAVAAEDSEVVEAAEVAGEDSEVSEAAEVAGEDSEVSEAAEVAGEDSEVVEAAEVAGEDSEVSEAAEVAGEDSEVSEAAEVAGEDSEISEAAEVAGEDSEISEAAEVAGEDSEVSEAAEVAGEDSEVFEAAEVAGEDSEVIEAVEVAAEDSEVIEAAEVAGEDSEGEGETT